MKKKGLKFDKLTMVPTRKVLKKDNTGVISLLMFYEDIKTMIFKVLGSVVYFIMYNYLCDDYMCLHKAKLYFSHKGFGKTTFNDNSRIGIS